MSVHNELPLGLHTHPPSPLQTSCLAARGPIVIQNAGTTNSVLTEFPASHGVSNAAGLQGGEGPLQMRNHLQPPANMPQKLHKRRYSMNMGFKHPGLSKRRRRANSECDPVLPTNFLLGGNIFDPLNLNSLLDDEVNKALNAQTPKSSPLPFKNRDPVEILIPKDITDPLNLNGTCGDATAGVLVSPIKSRRRHRNRHHAAVAGSVAGQLDLSDSKKSKVSEGAVSGLLFPLVTSLRTAATVSAEGSLPLGLQALEVSPRPYELNTSVNCRDEVVPPLLTRRRPHPSSSSTAPQAQSRPTSSASTAQSSKHRKHRRNNSRSDRLSITPTPPTKKTVAEKMHSQTFHTPGATEAFSLCAPKILQHRCRPQRKFQYGNYSHCYGYRTPMLNTDPRLAILRPEWFHGKKVLDIGCNTGHITLAIARHWSPNHILGVDIDGTLVHAARQNLRYFLSELCRLNPGQEKTNLSRATGESEGSEVSLRLTPLMHLQLDRVGGLSRFPLSFTRCRGPIATPPIMPHVPGLFPSNVSFLKGNYVPDTDAAVMSQSAEYDVILCLSLTKWVHLNFGDTGIQRLFHRIYRHLLPGGRLILEPQPWSSYGHCKRLTEVTHRNYSNIRLKPDQFNSFLTTDVGFSSYELISTPCSCTKGFQRPVYVFHKGSVANMNRSLLEKARESVSELKEGVWQTLVDKWNW